MGTKNNPGRFDCYAVAEPDEPMFILLGRDRHAAALVHLWAAMRMGVEGPESLKARDASVCANMMVMWRLQNRPDAPDLSGIRALANALAVLAEQTGVVVTIDQKPLQPLAMGNYVHDVQVRLKRVPS